MLMTSPRSLLPLGLALLFAPGCIIVGPGTSPGPGPGDPPVQTCNVGTCRGRPVSPPVSRIAAGAGAPDPGYDGVIITANIGGSYRVTWDNQWQGLTEVVGSVFASSGATPRFFPGCTDNACSLMGSDQVIVGSEPGRIDFNGFPSARVGRSGFDIVLAGGDGEQLWIDVLVNGQADPQRVVFPSTDLGTLASAPTLPFALTTR